MRVKTMSIRVKTRKYLLTGLSYFILFIVVSQGISWWRSSGAATGNLSRFNVELLDGARFEISAFSGKPVLLHFWASWCPVCALQQASIDRIARDHAVLTVALDDAGAQEIREWMRSRGVAYPVLHDAQGRIAGRFGVRGVPTSVVIDAHGEIRFVEVGYTTETGLRLRLWWVDS